MKFYAYLWVRRNGIPYYAGKGSGRRAFVRHRGNLRPPTALSRILIFYRQSEQDALNTEMELIQNWGRKDLGTGVLCNQSAGGEVPTQLSEKTKQRMAAAARRNKNATGHVMSSVTREKLRAAHPRGPRPVEVGARIRASKLGKPLAKDHRAKFISAENRKKAWDTRFLKTVAWG